MNEKCKTCYHANSLEHRYCFGYWTFTDEEIEKCKSYIEEKENHNEKED